MQSITRVFDWDMGHRVPNHKSKCHNVHGHRYHAEFELSGTLVSQDVSDKGMVMDFGDMKGVLAGFIDEYLDHGYMAQEKTDKEMIKLLTRMGYKLHVVPFVPTAENIAQYLLDVLSPRFVALYGNEIRLSSVTVYETPNCWAKVNA